MSAWADYKKRVGETRPWDLLNPKAERATENESLQRMNTCKGCDRFIGLTTQCKECGCVMAGKVKLKAASCPLGKW